MFTDVITVFNRYSSRSGDMWYPTVIHGANLLIDKAAIKAKYGAESKDSAILNIDYQTVEGQIFVAGKPYLPPKEWERQTDDKFPESITFKSGESFDFFMAGEYPEDPVADDDYTDGFYDHINASYDFVFSITSVAKYSAIPHFEIMGD